MQKLKSKESKLCRTGVGVHIAPLTVAWPVVTPYRPDLTSSEPKREGRNLIICAFSEQKLM